MRRRTAQVVFPLPDCITLDDTLKHQLLGQSMVFARVYRGGVHLYWQGEHAPLILRVTKRDQQAWAIDVLDQLAAGGGEHYLETSGSQLQYLYLVPEGCALELKKHSDFGELFQGVLPKLAEADVCPKRVIEGYIAERLCKEKSLVMTAQLVSDSIDSAVALVPMAGSAVVEQWIKRFAAQSLSEELPVADEALVVDEVPGAEVETSGTEVDASANSIEVRRSSSAWYGRLFTFAAIGVAAVAVIGSKSQHSNRP